MILEATASRPNLRIEYPFDVQTMAYIWLACVAIAKWLNVNTPKAEVYALTRYDLLRRRFILWPVASTFLASATFYLCLHWLCKFNTLLMVIGQGLEEVTWLA